MLTAALLLTAVMTPAAAHHGGALDWNFKEQVGPVTGKATKFGFRFPHIQIFIALPDENGEVRDFALVVRWTPTILRKHGWTRNSIKEGDEVTVTYFPHATNPDAGAVISMAVNGEPLVTDIE